MLKLFQDLRVGPWAHLRDMSPGAIFLRYREEILFFLGILVLLILNEIRLHVLFKKRTQALSEALERPPAGGRARAALGRLPDVRHGGARD